MRDEDQAVWENFIRGVTPLGEPEPNNLPVMAVERIIASHRLDLHGLSLKDAYEATLTFLEAATDRSVTIVTGLSGVIKREFPFWLEPMRHLRIEPLDGGGAYRIHFRRKRGLSP